ncbi:MAG: deoxyribodipyrimidine photo-lyase [Phycisphaerales bacterium]
MTTSIVWFQQDLRLDDHPALAAAAAAGRVAPLFIWDPEGEAPWAPGAARRWWMHHSLAALADSLERLGAPLRIVRGPAERVLPALAREAGAAAVHAHERVEPPARERHRRVEGALRAAGVEFHLHQGDSLFAPHEIVSGAGTPYRVFTPFWRACSQAEAEAPRPAPPRLEAPHAWSGRERGRDALDALGLRPRIRWDVHMEREWTPGEAGAMARARDFLEASLPGYATGRDRCDRPATSRLSPHLAHGELSPRRLWAMLGAMRAPAADLAKLRSELGWREFARHVLWHHPHTVDRPLRPEFDSFPWRDDAHGEERWRQGRTGFPLVDAGMRQLWATGWMHNRVRMVVASFLVKDLLLDWRRGAAWFWETLVDADLASNTLGWQWCAGCGADAAPFFRIFNPQSQGERFDPDGAYVRRWVPELAGRPLRELHRAEPAEDDLPLLSSRAIGVRPGGGYPAALVDHAAARSRALAALASVSRGR